MAFGFHSTAEEVAADVDLRGKTWLVTGANSGLGLESARVLASRGATIIAAARTAEKASKAFSDAGFDGVPLACDLSDLASVRRAVAEVAASGRRLDGVLANAGIMALPELQQKNGYELQFYTNHVGHFALVTGLVDVLNDGGRVVIVSSAAHRFALERGMELDNLDGARDYHPWRMYGRSKLANILFARALAARFSADGTGRVANSLHPGVIETNLGRHVPDRDGMYARLRPSMKTLGEGAATQVCLAVRPEHATTNGQYFSDCQPEKTIPQGQDDALGEALWTATERIVG
jgi:WW domain-containing oxidoreductase